MAQSRFSKLQFLLILSLLLVMLFVTTSGCSRRGRRRRFRHHNYRHGNGSYHDSDYETTTPYHYRKRNVDNTEYNEVRLDNEISRTNCGKMLCPKVINYPTEEIIDAVDRLHQHLRFGDSRWKILTSKRASYEQFFTSHSSKTLSKRPCDQWYLSDPSDGCKQHATVQFPQQGHSSIESQTYYVVNVRNLRQSLIEKTCTNVDQTCPNDKNIEASHVIRRCQQNYGQKQFVVLPMYKRHFKVKDFEVKSFAVPESCTCTLTTY